MAKWWTASVAKRRQEPSGDRAWRPGRVWIRDLLLAIVGFLVALFVAGRWLDSAWLQILYAGLVALGLLLTFPWWAIWTFDVDRTRDQAKGEDPGGLILLLTTALSFGGLAVSIAASDEVRNWIDRIGILAFAFLSWLLLHTEFALHYARLYYHDPDCSHGLKFFSDEPTNLSFAYFALTIGLTFQVSDVAVTNDPMRKVVMKHSVVSFGFVLITLAVAVDLVFRR
jgi:uncharacterized membrane protein